MRLSIDLHWDGEEMYDSSNLPDIYEEMIEWLILDSKMARRRAEEFVDRHFTPHPPTPLSDQTFTSIHSQALEGVGSLKQVLKYRNSHRLDQFQIKAIYDPDTGQVW